MLFIALAGEPGGKGAVPTLDAFQPSSFHSTARSHSCRFSLGFNLYLNGQSAFKALPVLSAENLGENPWQISSYGLYPHSRFLMQNPSTVYVGAVIAIVVLCTLGALLRLQANRRSA